jgi:hypothetical protein
LIRLLTDSNQSLLNQARTNDLNTLATINAMTVAQPIDEEAYMSTEAREMAAWYNSQGLSEIPAVDVEGYEEDMDILRSTM